MSELSCNLCEITREQAWIDDVDPNRLYAKPNAFYFRCSCPESKGKYGIGLSNVGFLWSDKLWDTFKAYSSGPRVNMHNICPHLFTVLKQFEEHRIHKQSTSITSAEQTIYSDGCVGINCINLQNDITKSLDKCFGDLVLEFERNQVSYFDPILNQTIYPPCTIKIKY